LALGKWGIYTLEAEIGRGGMAVVYRASKVRSGDFKRALCIKQILPSLSRNREFVSMFEQEARIAASLRHPNIVAVTDFNQVDGQLFLEMELIEGIDLEELLFAVRERGLAVTLGFARYVADGLLNALGHAHGRKVDGKPAPVIHRDVSPNNILISTNGEVKLTDFGIAKVRGASVVTETLHVKGKFSYLSPEQARGEKVDHRSDLFGAGLVLHELLTGERFNRGEDRGGEMARAQEPGDPGLPWLSTEWNDLLARLLARKPEDRYSSAEEALAALQRVPLPQPCDRDEAGRLVRGMRELIVDPGESQPTRVGVPVGSLEAEGSDRLAIGPPNKRSHTWAWVALAAVMAAGLTLSVNKLLDRSSTDSAAEELVSSAVDAQDAAVSTVAIGTIVPDRADAGVSIAKKPQARADAGNKYDARPARAAAPGPKSGRLEVNCRPWAHVFVDGRKVGTTPIKDLSVRSGKRRVTLRNDELGYERAFTVNVPRDGVGSLSKDITPVEPTANPHTDE